MMLGAPFTKTVGAIDKKGVSHGDLGVTGAFPPILLRADLEGGNLLALERAVLDDGFLGAVDEHPRGAVVEIATGEDHLVGTVVVEFDHIHGLDLNITVEVTRNTHPPCMERMPAAPTQALHRSTSVLSSIGSEAVMTAVPWDSV
jgi:hypothetical protein